VQALKDERDAALANCAALIEVAEQKDREAKAVSAVHHALSNDLEQAQRSLEAEVWVVFARI
jgi:hypothetical protein